MDEATEAEAAIRRVLALHQKHERDWPDQTSPNCTECGGDDWPCATVAAVQPACWSRPQERQGPAQGPLTRKSSNDEGKLIMAMTDADYTRELENALQHEPATAVEAQLHGVIQETQRRTSN